MDTVYIVMMYEIEGGWVAGAYGTESEARAQAATASSDALRDAIEFDAKDVGGFGVDPDAAHWHAASAVVEKVHLGIPAKWDFPGSGETVARYRYGLDTSTMEYKAAYDDNGHPKRGADPEGER